MFESPLMYFRSAVGQQIFRQKLTRKRRGLGWEGLLLRRNFSRNIAGRIFAVLDGKKRRSVCAVKKIDESLLRGLRDRGYIFSVALHSHEGRRCGKIAVPEVVPDTLEVPDPLTGFGVQRDQTVGEEIVANAVGRVEIKRR